MATLKGKHCCHLGKRKTCASFLAPDFAFRGDRAEARYLVTCASRSSARRTGRAWEARCTAAAGAGREDTAGLGRPGRRCPAPAPPPWSPEAPILTTLLCTHITLSSGLKKHQGSHEEDSSAWKEQEATVQSLVQLCINRVLDSCLLNRGKQNRDLGDPAKEQKGSLLHSTQNWPLLGPQASTHQHRPCLTGPQQCQTGTGSSVSGQAQ